jgi:hypothetical protein
MTAIAQELSRSTTLQDVGAQIKKTNNLNVNQSPISSGRLVFHAKRVFEALDKDDWDVVASSMFQGIALAQSSKEKNTSLLVDYYQTHFLLAVIKHDKDKAMHFLRKRYLVESKNDPSNIVLLTEYDKNKSTPVKELGSRIREILERYPARDVFVRTKELSAPGEGTGGKGGGLQLPVASDDLFKQSQGSLTFNKSLKPSQKSELFSLEVKEVQGR